MDEGAVVLSDRGFWLADGNFSTRGEAFEAASAVVRRRCRADGVDVLPVIGDFVIPPADGPASRDFQTLHFDFGLPLVPIIAGCRSLYRAVHRGPAGARVRVAGGADPAHPHRDRRGRDSPGGAASAGHLRGPLRSRRPRLLVVDGHGHPGARERRPAPAAARLGLAAAHPLAADTQLSECPVSVRSVSRLRADEACTPFRAFRDRVRQLTMRVGHSSTVPVGAKAPSYMPVYALRAASSSMSAIRTDGVADRHRGQTSCA
jgi:hypothetical protein